jgi:hypothetical protein
MSDGGKEEKNCGGKRMSEREIGNRGGKIEIMRMAFLVI